jgi:hypothetical protein
MNSVDRADQIRTYYRTNRRNYRTWKPLWNYLFQTTICNAALIWIDQGSSTKKEGGHLNFRKKLATQLMAHSSPSMHTSPIDGSGVRTNLQNHVVTSTNACNGVCVIPSHIAKECKACMAQGRTAQASGKRMAMQERSVNSVRIKEDGEKVRRSRPPRTRHGCSVYQIHLCQRGTLLGRAYSVDNQGLGDSYEVLCPLKFRRLLPRMASYAGALALNFRRLVPGKPSYPGAWPLNFRGLLPGKPP